jgi:molybdenum cofactor cytidylyltransferase
LSVRGGVVVLAAGSASRFGSDKRTHRLPEGESLLQATVAKYVDQFPELVVVLRPEDHALADRLMRRFDPDTVTIVFAQDARLGMGHSLAAGIRAAKEWDFAFVALGDMPFVKPQTLAALGRAMADAGQLAIMQPVHAGQPGHPVGFGRRHFPALRKLTGDEGARQLVKAAAGHLVRVEVDDPGVLQDVDTPADLAGI